MNKNSFDKSERTRNKHAEKFSKQAGGKFHGECSNMWKQQLWEKRRSNDDDTSKDAQAHTQTHEKSTWWRRWLRPKQTIDQQTQDNKYPHELKHDARRAPSHQAPNNEQPRLHCTALWEQHLNIPKHESNLSATYEQHARHLRMTAQQQPSSKPESKRRTTWRKLKTTSEQAQSNLQQRDSNVTATWQWSESNLRVPPEQPPINLQATSQPSQSDLGPTSEHKATK